MIECIVCKTMGCETVHSAEAIVAATPPKKCYVCGDPAINAFCEKPHTIDEIKNPRQLTPEEFRDCLRICVAYAKLVEYRDSHG